MVNSADVEAYFGGIVNRHVELVGYTFGLMDELVNGTAKAQRFPLLHAEPPEISFSGARRNRERSAKVSFTVFIQRSARPGDIASDQTTEGRRTLADALAKAQEIAEDVLTMLEHDFVGNLEVVVDASNATLEGVTALTANADMGYRCELFVRTKMNGCPDMSKWN
jgi:hypothetical protein